MARWDHGYVTDVAYTTNAYQETTPSWLAACSVLLGYRPAGSRRHRSATPILAAATG